MGVMRKGRERGMVNTSKRRKGIKRRTKRRGKKRKTFLEYLDNSTEEVFTVTR